MEVKNTIVHENLYDGIRTAQSTSTIINSLIYKNGSPGSSYYGINLGNPSSNPTIRNNTIVHNINEGIRFVGSNAPTVSNCIIWYNNWKAAAPSQMDGLEFGDISYCCITNPNDPNALNPTTDPVTHNMTYKPDFVYDSEPYGFYHIKYESHCRNAGDNTYVDVNEVDMDNQTRIQEIAVDIGADEVSCTDTLLEYDWTYDGVINYKDFSIISAAWLTHDPCDPDVITDPNYSSDPNYADPNAFVNWNPTCDINDDYAVDLSDLVLFIPHWLERACWWDDYSAVIYGMPGGSESMMMAAPAMESSVYKSDSFSMDTILEILDFVETCIIETEDATMQGCLELKAILEEWLY